MTRQTTPLIGVDPDARDLLGAAGFEVLVDGPPNGEPAVAVGGAQAVREAVEAGHELVVAAVEGADRRLVLELLEAGATGVLLLDATPEAVRTAIAAVRAGHVVAPASYRAGARRPLLTTRQKQVLGLVVLGLSNADVAQRLFLSEVTVKTHLTAIFKELGVKSRTEAIDLVLDPASGIGTEILGIADPRATQAGYGRPSVR